MKIIAYSLWGNNPAYLDGALTNAKLAATHYPGWKLRIYCHKNVPVRALQDLRAAGFETIGGLNAPDNSWEGLFWRFQPVFEKGVTAFLSRDCDSRLNPREAAAVAEWLESGRLLHTMRDHYEHIVPILGGMWGCRRWPEFASLYAAWQHHTEKGSDQDFLSQSIWPLARLNCLAHDRYTIRTIVAVPGGRFTYDPVEFFGEHDVRPFPSHQPLIPATHGEHVGARVGMA